MIWLKNNNDMIEECGRQDWSIMNEDDEIVVNKVEECG